MALELVDPNNPEKGYMVVEKRSPYLAEYDKKLGELSITDGVPIITEAPPEIPRRANFGSIQRFVEDRSPHESQPPTPQPPTAA